MSSRVDSAIPFDLDEEHSAGVGRVAGVVVSLDRADRDAVHHFER